MRKQRSHGPTTCRTTKGCCSARWSWGTSRQQSPTPREPLLATASGPTSLMGIYPSLILLFFFYFSSLLAEKCHARGPRSPRAL